MKIIVKTHSGRSIAEGCKDILKRVLSAMSDGQAISQSLEDDIRLHMSQRHPGSSHWSPSKVNAQPAEQIEGQVSGSAAVAIPGAARAYHDITIRPVSRQFITIPMHSHAYGKKPAEEAGMFVWTSKNGNAFLAKNEGRELRLMWLLAREAFQKQDKTLMPEDDTLADSIFMKISTDIKTKASAA